MTSMRPPDADEVERLARLDGIELAPGEAGDLAPVIATLTASVRRNEDIGS